MGCLVALTVTGIWFLTPYRRLPLDAQAIVDLAALCVWPASLLFQNVGAYAQSGGELTILVAECVAFNAITYAMLFIVGGWAKDAALRRWPRQQADP